MATRVGVVKIYLTSFDSLTPKIPRCKDRGDVSYTSLVIAIVAWNFVAMATEVGRDLSDSFSSPTPKTPN